MIADELYQVCKDEFDKLLHESSYSSIDEIGILKSMAFKIEASTGISKYSLSTFKRANEKYLKCTFEDEYGNACKVAIKENLDTLVNDLANSITDVQDGLDAVHILNNAIEALQNSSIEGIKLRYALGNGAYCYISNWTFESVLVRLSSESTNKLIEMYRKGENWCTAYLTRLIEGQTMPRDILSFIKGFNDNSVSIEICSKMSSSEPSIELVNYMLNRGDAIKYIVSNANKNGTLVISVVERVNQLGSFVALTTWKVNYKNKSIDIKINGERIIDLENSEIVSNYTICSRVEQALTIKSHELQQVFSGQD